MPVTAPIANIYLQIVAQLKTACPNIAYIDQDLGQLEHYELRPAVSLPCALIDIDDIAFEHNGDNAQTGEGIVQVRIAHQPYSASNSLAPDEVRQKALDYYEREQDVYLALQGFSHDNFRDLNRVSAKTEKRNDPLRVRVIRFRFGMEDYTAMPNTTPVNAPAVVISLAMEQP